MGVNNVDVLAIIETKDGYLAHSYVNENGRVYSYIVKYVVIYNVKTNISKGAGKIEVAESNIPGNPVTFNILPEKGYKVGKVKVTDKNGNTIIFTNNTFTMPDVDVTIDVTFVKESIITNPETVDYVVLSVLLLLIASYTGLRYYKKIKYLN